jgi:hypothetical protein
MMAKVPGWRKESPMSKTLATIAVVLAAIGGFRVWRARAAR